MGRAHNNMKRWRSLLADCRVTREPVFFPKRELDRLLIFYLVKDAGLSWFDMHFFF